MDENRNGNGDFWNGGEQSTPNGQGMSGAPYEQNYYTNQQTGGAYGQNGQPYGQNGTAYGQQTYGYDTSSYYTYDRAAQKKAQKLAKKQARAEARARYKERSKGSFAGTLGKCAVIALVFGLVAGSAFSGVVYFSGVGSRIEQGNDLASGQDETLPAASVENGTASGASRSVEESTGFARTALTGLPDVSDIVEETMPSIVSITNMATVTGMTWFGQQITSEEEYAGSGIIVASDDEYLYIATNNHVVAGANTLTVQFSDDETAAAEVKGTSESNDLAVIEVKLSELDDATIGAIKVAKIDASGDYAVGSSAIAIGNALGYGQSVTVGYISAVDREVTIQDDTTGTYFTSKLIQTDAAINPGNSGGALLNAAGEVIGINSSKYSDTSVEGMGFAIPMSTAQPIIDNIINREEVDETEAAYIGIAGIDVDSTVAATYGMPTGVYVSKIYKGSPASKSDLMVGDIITSFDGNKVGSMEELHEILKYYSAGTDVTLTVYRANAGVYETVDVDITLGLNKSE